MIRRRSELELFNALARDGKPEDLAEFADRLRRCVFWVLHRMAGGLALVGEAEDIVAESQFRLEQLRTRGFSGSPPEFKAYLYKVVVSACVEATRHHRFVASLDAPVTLPDGDEKPLGNVLQELVTADLAVDQALEREEEAGLVRRALKRLDDRCQRLLTRFHLENQSIREIARSDNARQNTVEVALTRCRNRLYAAFLGLYVERTNGPGRERVAKIGGQLPGVLGRVFAAWWTENRSVLDISKEVGLSPAEAKRLLGQAKLEVWRLLQEGPA